MQPPVPVRPHAGVPGPVAAVERPLQVSVAVVPAEKWSPALHATQEHVGEGAHEVGYTPDEIVLASGEQEVVAVRPGIVTPVSPILIWKGMWVRIPVGRAFVVEVPRIPHKDPGPIHLDEEFRLEGLVGLLVQALLITEAAAEVRVHRVGAAVLVLRVDLQLTGGIPRGSPRRVL